MEFHFYMRILFTGASTGGHIFPIIAIARQIKKNRTQSEPSEMFFLGPADFSLDYLKKEDIKVKTIFAGKIRRYFSFWTILDFFKLIVGFIQSLYYLWRLMPDVIFSKGGYGGVPVVLAAWFYKIPVITHESDTIPGLANRITAKIAEKVIVSFESAKEHLPSRKTALLGNPVRQDMIEACLADDEEKIQKAKADLGIKTQRPIILVLGGSQGAYKINEIIFKTLPELLKNYEVIHQCGRKNYDDFSEMIKQTDNDSGLYHLFPFLDQDKLSKAYLASDLVISRAGSVVFEISACRKPSILIPLSNSAGNHQQKNAFTCGRLGMSVVLEEANLTPNLFLKEVAGLLGDSEKRQKMIRNTENLSYPEAAQNIVEILIETAK